jgi:DNA invertase Pin-like site-specific DNA recombinase
MGINFGYMRVSTSTQVLDRQEDALLPFVSLDENGNPYLYSDKASGKDMERERFQEMFRTMRYGDTLYIKSIDRLGRNKHQIKDYLEKFRQKGIRLKILDMPTTMQEHSEDWVIELVNNILLEVYTSIAEQEREMILKRQREGIEIARAKGKHLGRPPVELPDCWGKLFKQWKKGEIKSIEFMELVEMKKPTFYKKIKDYEESLQE